MTKKIKAQGGCLCGAVSVTVEEMRPGFGACHCSMCRQWGGGPMLSVGCGTAVRFTGEEHISVFHSSEWAERGFCKQCGSHLFYKMKPTGAYNIPVGLFGEKIKPRFTLQVYIDKKPDNYAFANKTRNVTEKEILAMYAPDS
ncbi:MAG: GFA family protein [Leptospiraceae bacterium]|nr:GFA family protein [Leptospiraceae bacterium]MCB1318799.1 GFA family protein [Leptospiraceae bacterium]